jgi:outer membrane protein TolC
MDGALCRATWLSSHFLFLPWQSIRLSPLAQGSGLSLSAALAQTMAQNPGLKVFDPRFQGLDGLRITADQNPALIAGVQVEDFLGSGNLQGADSAEYTLSLSSVLELGGKRESRVSVIDSRLNLVEAERRAETLDVLGQVTQRFVATLALQEKLQLAGEAVALAETTHDIVAHRAKQGGHAAGRGVAGQGCADEASHRTVPSAGGIPEPEDGFGISVGGYRAGLCKT